MEVREARPEDAQEACAVLRRSILGLCSADHGHDPKLLAAWLANKTPENFTAWMMRSDASYLLAIAAVGAIADDVEILLNYVSPDARFLGTSKTLLAALEGRATERGARQCTLISTETARRFYRARGFQETGDWKRKFGMESGYPMAKALAPSACDAAPTAYTPGKA